ncbi:hypothetical protein C4J81_06455 [Deltaproteobacteria bacterium Smac51]|nr:hypothetical protein C4J81_06455 [Deltaproteobacteria bacterium Smac51]
MNPGGNGNRVSRRKKWFLCALCIIAGLALAYLAGRAALGDLTAAERVRGLKGPAALTSGN